MQTWLVFFFFFNDTATTEIYTLSLHDALPHLKARGGNVLNISATLPYLGTIGQSHAAAAKAGVDSLTRTLARSEEHTSELQSRENLVCRLLLEKKKNTC